MLGVGLSVDDRGGESAAADGGAWLQTELGDGPRWSVDHGGDGGFVALEEAVDEGVQEGVTV